MWCARCRYRRYSWSYVPIFFLFWSIHSSRLRFASSRTQTVLTAHVHHVQSGLVRFYIAPAVRFNRSHPLDDRAVPVTLMVRLSRLCFMFLASVCWSCWARQCAFPRIASPGRWIGRAKGSNHRAGNIYPPDRTAHVLMFSLLIIISRRHPYNIPPSSCPSHVSDFFASKEF